MLLCALRKDLNQIAAGITAITTGTKVKEEVAKNPAAVASGGSARAVRRGQTNYHPNGAKKSQKIRPISLGIKDKNKICIKRTVFYKQFGGKSNPNMLSQNQAHELLGPDIIRAVTEIIEKANRHRLRVTAAEAGIIEPRTRASFMNDLMIHFAKRILPPLGATVLKCHNRIIFDIKGVALLTFKKLNKNRIGSNIPTQFALNFASQGDLPGIPSRLDRLVAGYTPNPDWSSFEGIFITLPNGKSVEWSLPLETASNLTEMPKPKINEKQPKTDTNQGFIP